MAFAHIFAADLNYVAVSPVGRHAFNEANAALIATAPDLLAALDRLAEITNGLLTYDVATSEQRRLIVDALTQAAEAAQKARGQ